MRNRLALLLGSRELGVEPLENELVRFWVVDLMPCALSPGVYTQKPHPRPKTGEDAQ